MVAQKFGKSDRDLRAKGSKEKSDKPMLKASAVLPTTGMVGGIANKPVKPSDKKVVKA